MFLFHTVTSGQSLVGKLFMNILTAIALRPPFRDHNIKTKSRPFPAEPLPISANIAIFLSNSEYHRTFSFSDSQDRRAALCLFKQSVELDTVVDVV